MRFYRKHLLLIASCFACFFLSFFSSEAQPHSTNTLHQIKFQHLGLKEGLSQSTINFLMQDSRGFLWVATQDGLNCYDGYKFRVYNFDPLDTNSLSYGYVTCLYEDDKGIIWIGTNGLGLNSFNTRNGKFRSYRHDENDPNSLGNDEVKQILPDHSGSLWIITEKSGVSRLNPVTLKFDVFKRDGTDSTAISCNNIKCMLARKDGKVWFGSSCGVDVFDPSTEKFTGYWHKPGDAKSLSNDIVETIVDDNKGNLWIGTWNGVNVMNLETKIVTTIKNDIPETKAPGCNVVKCILIDRKGNVWAGTQNGLNVIDQVTHKVKRYIHSENKSRSLSDNTVTQLLEDSKGQVWIATSKGLNMYVPESDDFNVYTHDENDLSSLSSDEEIKLFEDRNSTLWVGTRNDLNFFSPQAKRFRVMRHEDNNPFSLASNEVWTVFEDMKGRMWVGTHSGLTSFEPKSGDCKQYHQEENNPNSLPDDYIQNISGSVDGLLWIGTHGGGLCSYDLNKKIFKRFLDSASVPETYISAVCVDKSGKIWVGTSDGVFLLDPKGIKIKNFSHHKSDPETISNDDIYYIHAASDGLVWVCTAEGLNSIDPVSGKVKRYLHSNSDSTSISFDNINSIYEDAKGILWVGTFGGGLNRMDLHTPGKFIHYTERDGLPNNVVYDIASDSKGNLWLSTNKGLCRFTPPAEKGGKVITRNFDEQDGLPTNEFNGGACCKSRDGHIYFGSVSGLVFFHPDSLSGNPMPSPVYITSFKIFEKELPLDTAISYKKAITLNFKQNFISFEFVTLNFVSSDKNQYAYKLEGVDDEWIYCGNRRYASYTSLDPGEYIFRVKASNNDGVWNETGNYIHIRITPPFWRTKWFYFLCFIIVIAGIAGFTRFRTYKLRVAKKELERKVHERTVELKSTNDKLSIAYTDIKDSIQYAKRIQEAILPLDVNVKAGLPESFIYFKPRDIVSGDFYWYSAINGNIYIASCDCTGHGVPGAFMSLIGSTLLNDIVNHKQIHDPAEILTVLHNEIRTALKQDSFKTESRDGMDLALCVFNKDKKTVIYSGAMRPLYIIRKASGELEEIKADKFPIGGVQSEEKRVFKKHELKLEEGDIIYMFSDGYPDQFGGTKGKKITNKRFKEFLTSIRSMPMQQQQEKLANLFDNWKGELEQIDDVLVIGIRV